MLNFNDIFVDDTKYGMKIPKEKYLSVGLYPVIDQSKEQIAGYTDESEGIYCDVPAIIFGDHTRIIKYIDVPFFLGADGTKLLKIKDNTAFNCKYLYYALSNAKIPNTGYNRHFKWLKELSFNIPSIEKQREIADLMDIIVNLENLMKKQLEKLELFVKSRFIEMFGDPVTNQKGWEKVRLADKCSIITGNTPPRANKEYYGSYIEWIKSDNITSNMYLTQAAEYLSLEGLVVGRKVDPGSILMTCIAGSLKSIGNVAIANRPITFNQQINAVVPNEQNTLFMYEQFKLAKEYITSDVNMALKGILSKGQLSEKQFIFPPIDLQNQFADFVAQVDKSKLAIQQSLDELETLKKSLMQQYFG